MTPYGIAIAFPVAEARTVLEGGGEVGVGEVRLVLDGGGICAGIEDGTALAAHQAFWFAWSQFGPDTLVWHRK